MMDTQTTQDIADQIKSLLVSAHGTFSPADFAAVAKNLGFRIDLEPHALPEYSAHAQKKDGEGFWAIAPGASDISEGMVWMKRTQGAPPADDAGAAASLAALCQKVESIP
jgi:hypothetical protein